MDLINQLSKLETQLNYGLIAMYCMIKTTVYET